MHKQNHNTLQVEHALYVSWRQTQWETPLCMPACHDRNEPVNRQTYTEAAFSLFLSPPSLLLTKHLLFMMQYLM
jgi:hypothetical protein